jgi:hypothetical protein
MHKWLIAIQTSCLSEMTIKQLALYYCAVALSFSMARMTRENQKIAKKFWFWYF